MFHLKKNRMKINIFKIFLRVLFNTECNFEDNTGKSNNV